MKNKNLPLEEISIRDLYRSSDKKTYEVPIYQRNYAWEIDEIRALVQDIFDAFSHKDLNEKYFIGTLVTFYKGDEVYEVIDGQQRLTTIYLLLRSLGETISNPLTYRARKKADTTLKAINRNESLQELDIYEKDTGLEAGFEFAKKALKEIVPEADHDAFRDYFLNKVRLIHYQVPKDIDLNHYFEIMNSRGEQLEKHEIVKARLMNKLQDNADRRRFALLWDCCSNMSTYIQQQYASTACFSSRFSDYTPGLSFSDLPEVISNNKKQSEKTENDSDDKVKAFDTLNAVLDELSYNAARFDTANEYLDKFQAIIDFPNFLLITLKLTCLKDGLDFIKKTNSAYEEIITLDDKELINEFERCGWNDTRVKLFALNLLQARYLLDNYIVHHANNEKGNDNPWQLQRWSKENGEARLTDLSSRAGNNEAKSTNLQEKLVHLLSMLEVSFTARQRKNYLFYCLFYLFNHDKNDLEAYGRFLEKLSDKFFFGVYMNKGALNAQNTPLPGMFDKVVIPDRAFDLDIPLDRTYEDFKKDFGEIYGDGENKECPGMPLFIFNYLDYKIWKLYATKLRGEKEKGGSKVRNEFFEQLGCSDFSLKPFRQFYFSRTRRSLEHYYPQANAGMFDGYPTKMEINCLGNYAMIGSAANSAGSNWSPSEKVNRYLDSSEKINPSSVASLKFRIMMQKCADNEHEPSRNKAKAWTFEDIKEHQTKMLELILEETASSE